MTDADQPPPPRRSWVKRGGLILLGVVAAAYCVWFFLVVPNLRPAFESVDAVDAGQVRSMTVFVLNRPGGGPDVGELRNPLAIAPEDFEGVLGVFRNAERIDKERGIYLGQLKVTLADGRRQPVMLYRYAPTAKGPWALRFKIGGFQYEAGPVDRLLRVLDACEAKSKAGAG